MYDVFSMFTLLKTSRLIFTETEAKAGEEALAALEEELDREEEDEELQIVQRVKDGPAEQRSRNVELEGKTYIDREAREASRPRKQGEVDDNLYDRNYLGFMSENDVLHQDPVATPSYGAPPSNFDWHAPQVDEKGEVTTPLPVRPKGYVVTIAGSQDYNALVVHRDGIGTEASFLAPFGLAVTPSGSLIVADKKASRIRQIDLAEGGFWKRVMRCDSDNDNGDGDIEMQQEDGSAAEKDGGRRDYGGETNSGNQPESSSRHPPWQANVTTIAGCGMFGWWDGPADWADFYHPSDVTCNATSGDIFICDKLNHRIRRLSPKGEVVTFAGGLGMLQEQAPAEPKDDMLKETYWHPEYIPGRPAF
eukprot:jgi/Bigna1/131099/aug1.13_g5807